jgi:predicted esterase
VGDPCTTSLDCFAALACTAQTCQVVPPGLPTFGSQSGTGVMCEPPAPSPVRAYFEVPGAMNAKLGDFFRLPFPNDIRIKNGKLDFMGFPTPGSALLGYDPVQIYIDALVANESAWGAYPTVIFRFSGDFDFASFTGVGAPHWIDITKGAPEYKGSAGLSWGAPGPNNYVCDNWLALRRPNGAPLQSGHTYAVWITTAGRAADGSPIQRAENLMSVLSNTPPTDPGLSNAYSAFAPFRDYLTTQSIDPATVLNATVITVGGVRSPMTALAAAVEVAPVPTAKNWVHCVSGAVSPCPQASAERACGDSSAPQYDEYHALVSLPIFQQGTPPYLLPSDGGAVTTAGPVRTEDVCMALTVPKGAMPASGWPLVVFAHGTGGSFRSHVVPEIAGALSNAAKPTGTVPFAVLGIDQVEHGPRRGASMQSPNDLFFNFGNPAAARGNPLQGAADQIALARFAAALDVSAAMSGGAAIKIDPNAIVFFGHSQGATEGSLALPHTDLYKGAVLSGNGASLMDALVTKTSPVNIAAGLPYILGDIDSLGGLPGSNNHPALTVIQQWIDPADPLNFAAAIGFAPLMGKQAKPAFETYGLSDTYSPPVTLATFAIAAGMTLAVADPSVTKPDDIGLTPQPVPLTGNPTLAVRQYAASTGKDGHFVVFDLPSANADAVRFLAMTASGEVPQVGQ